MDEFNIERLKNIRAKIESSEATPGEIAEYMEYQVWLALEKARTDDDRIARQREFEAMIELSKTVAAAKRIECHTMALDALERLGGNDQEQE